MQLCSSPQLSIVMGLVRRHQSSHVIATQPGHFVDRTGWQAKMASIDFGCHDVMHTAPIVFRLICVFLTLTEYLIYADLCYHNDVDVRVYS